MNVRAPPGRSAENTLRGGTRTRCSGRGLDLASLVFSGQAGSACRRMQAGHCLQQLQHVTWLRRIKGMILQQAVAMQACGWGRNGICHAALQAGIGHAYRGAAGRRRGLHARCLSTRRAPRAGVHRSSAACAWSSAQRNAASWRPNTLQASGAAAARRRCAAPSSRST